MKNKVVLGAITIVLSSFVVTPISFAQTLTPTGVVSVSPRPTRSTTVSSQARACEVIVKRMTARLSMYQDREAAQVVKYQKVTTVTTALLASLDTQGKDTTQARADLAVFSTDVAKLQTDFAAFASKMSEVTALPCTNVQMYLSKVQEARTLLRVVRTDHGAIQKFYNSVLRTDLLKLRDKGVEVSGTRAVTPKPSITHVKPSAKPTHVPELTGTE
jgi:hypothetical protein